LYPFLLRRNQNPKKPKTQEKDLFGATCAEKLNTPNLPNPETVRNEIYDNFLPTCYSSYPFRMSTPVYAVASHRSFDNYFARFVGFANSLKEVQAAFPAVAKQLAILEHNKTLTFRIPYIDHRIPDEYVVLRYDIPADAKHLYVQYIRWKYAGLTMSATTGDKPAIPREVDMLSDCVYDATLQLNPPPLPPSTNTVSIISV
jgi:hypothetical protein